MLQGFEVEAVRSVFAADAGVDLTRFDYAILSDADQRVVERFELYARERELARDFAAAHVPVLELVPERDSLSGPTLRVYRLPDAASR
jgi:hypothetical protein